MTHAQGPHHQDVPTLQKRVAELEQELKLLEARLRQSQPTPVEKSTPESGLIKNAWLIPFGQYLLIESDNANINDALEKLGTLFGVVSCSLWRITHPSTTGVTTGRAKGIGKPGRSIWYRAGKWQPDETLDLCQNNWIENALGHYPEAQKQLCEGLPTALPAFDISPNQSAPASLKAGAINSLLVPVRRFNSLEGLVILQRTHESDWNPRDLDRLMFIATALLNLDDRQQLLNKLNIRDSRFNYAIEASSDGLWDWNITSGKIYFSRSYLRMLGYHYEELPGNLTTLRDYFLYPDDADMVMNRYQEAIRNHDTAVNLQYRMQHQSGAVIWVQSKTKFCEPDEQGRPTRCVGLNNNITDFILAREDLLAAKTQADMANKTKSEFLARMSHEIRTPMNAIIGLGYLLKDTQLDEQQKSYLGSLNSASDSLLHIINELLDFSKIDSGKIILEHSHFDLDQLFEKISRLFEISSTHKDIRIIYDIRAEVPRFLRGDAARLSQILDQLITNALQYSETNEVIVGVKLRDANIKYIELEFNIIDYGVGIAPEKLQKINESLINHTDFSDTRHRGFGLSICDHLVRLMNGTMSLTSKLKQGCCVTFTARFDYSHLGSRLLGKKTRELKNIRTLIVDDNYIARMVMASTAKSIGLTVDHAESAEQAIDIIIAADVVKKPFHFVLMDYRLPQMNGIEAAAAIKRNSHLSIMPHIILVSAYHRDEISDIDSCALDVEEFLSKPVSESRLLETISNSINRDEHLQTISAIHIESSTQDTLLQNLRILVAEDNLVNQQVVRGVLKKKSIQVTVVNNGFEAVDAVNNSETGFDLILMDLEMPEMDGLTATQTIRASGKTPNIPIIALTAQAMRGDRERCLASGMNAYLSKPINPELLYKTIAEQFKDQCVTEPEK